MHNRIKVTSILLVGLVTSVWGARIIRSDQTNDEEFANSLKEKRSSIDKEQDVTRPVNLRYPSAVLFGRTCGGTIISPTWILTAAHCTLFTSGRGIVAGTNNTENDTGITKSVKTLVIHPLFSVGPYWVNADIYKLRQVAARYDFMLAELTEPLTLDGTAIAAAELDDRVTLPPGEQVGYAGFGTDIFGGTMRSEMHAMDLEVRSDEDCSTMEQYNPQDMLCAQGRPPRGDSACNGDSGSGLIRNGRLLGILSWAEDDAHACEAGKKVVFARIAAVREWIRTVAKV